MSFLFDLLRSAFLRMLQLIWFGKKKISNSLSIYVKTNTGNTLSVDLDPKWDIRNVKEIVGPKLGISPEDIKIIFAGKELHNSTIIEECDLGQQSILHAIRLPPSKRRLKKNENAQELIEESIAEGSESNESGSKPMNETLVDLPLDDSDPQEANSDKVQQRDRAHFYVYCSLPCKSVEVGKLRVRCATCGSGAVTVDRDPQCWPDVQLPHRITVHCENDDCQVLLSSSAHEEQDSQLRYAQFYFKCANHASLGEQDEAVPLYLIKPNLRNVPCLACTDTRVTAPVVGHHPVVGHLAHYIAIISVTHTTVVLIDGENLKEHKENYREETMETVLVFPCEAGHVTCLDCFRDYCVARLGDRQFEFDDNQGYYTLPCPAGCQNSHIVEVHHFRLLSSQQYEQYQRFGTEEYVLRAGGLLCPRPDCGMGIIPPVQSEEDRNKSPDDDDCRRIQCIGGCGYVFCRRCLQGFHVGECNSQQPTTFSSSSGGSCPSGYAVDPLKASEAKWDEASNKTIQISTKPCPKCRTPTERDGGCMHMVCTRAGCGFQWCWVCQTQWTRDCMGSHWFG